MTAERVVETPCSSCELQDLEAQTTELAAHLSAATYRLLLLLREFDERSGWGGTITGRCTRTAMA
jgi:hypothetical protein